MNNFLIKSNKNLIESIPLISFGVALNMIFLNIIRFMPLSSLIFYYILPTISFFIAIKIKSFHYLIYSILSILSILITSFIDLTYLTSFLVPSLIISYLISYSFKNNIDIKFTYLISILSNFLFFLITIPLNNYLYNYDFISLISDLLKISTLNTISLIFIILSIKLALLHLFLYLNFKKYITYKLKFKYDSIYLILSLILTIFTIIIFKKSLLNSTIFVEIALISTILYLLSNFKNNLKFHLIELIINTIIVFITYILTYKYFTFNEQIIFIAILLFLNALNELIFLLIKKKFN